MESYLYFSLYMYYILLSGFSVNFPTVMYDARAAF